MRLFPLRRHFVAVLFLVLAAAAGAQTRGTVRNAQGKPIPAATITDLAGKQLAVSSSDGTFTLNHPPAQIEVSAPHYVTAIVTIIPARAVDVILRQPLETITVTAYRTALGSSDSPASTRVLDTQQLQQSASPSLDGKLRQIPGFELFRRSSSLVANPTTEGVSLRGLGSTAASRSSSSSTTSPSTIPTAAGFTGKNCPSSAFTPSKSFAVEHPISTDRAPSAA